MKEPIEGAGFEDGVDTGVEAASEAAESRSRLDEDVVAESDVIGLGLENGGDDGNGSELEKRELLGAVTDDLVLDFTEGYELGFWVGVERRVRRLVGNRVGLDGVGMMMMMMSS